MTELFRTLNVCFVRDVYARPVFYFLCEFALILIFAGGIYCSGGEFSESEASYEYFYEVELSEKDAAEAVKNFPDALPDPDKIYVGSKVRLIFEGAEECGASIMYEYEDDSCVDNTIYLPESLCRLATIYPSNIPENLKIESLQSAGENAFVSEKTFYELFDKATLAVFEYEEEQTVQTQAFICDYLKRYTDAALIESSDAEAEEIGALPIALFVLSVIAEIAVLALVNVRKRTVYDAALRFGVSKFRLTAERITEALCFTASALPIAGLAMNRYADIATICIYIVTAMVTSIAVQITETTAFTKED